MWDSLVLTARSYQNINTRLHLRTTRGQILLKTAVWVFFLLHSPPSNLINAPLASGICRKGADAIKTGCSTSSLNQFPPASQDCMGGAGAKRSFWSWLLFSFSSFPPSNWINAPLHLQYAKEGRTFQLEHAIIFLFGLPLGTSQRTTAPFVLFCGLKGRKRKGLYFVLM